MTIEITNLEEFKDKFAHLMAAHVNLISAGTEPSALLSSKMIDEFIGQFTATTPAPAPALIAGYVVVCNMTGYIPGDFTGVLYDSPQDALLAITRWIAGTGHGRASAYGVREVTYFG